MKKLLICIYTALCLLCAFSGCAVESDDNYESGRNEISMTVEIYYTLDDFSGIIPGISTVKDVEAIAPINGIIPLSSGGMECFFPMEDGRKIFVLCRGDILKEWESLIVTEIRIRE